MAKIKDPNRELAFNLWKDNPDITNREIARRLEVDEKKIATWKLRDKWKERVNGISLENNKTTLKKKNCSTTKNVDVIQQSKECNTTKQDKVVDKNVLDFLSETNLTEKQRLFCIYYIQSFNATQSAIKAGYSKDSAFIIGHENLRKPKIKEYLKELKELYAKDDYLETKRLLDRHKQIAFADIKDFTEFQIEKVFMEYDEETGKPIFDKRFQFRIKDDVEVDGTLIKKIGMGKFGPVIELEDRSKSLEFLNKVYGLDPTFKIQIEKIDLEKNKIKVLEDRNRIIESANRPITGKVKDMQKDEKINLLKKLGGA